jgi:hypothetical protein
MKQGNVYTHIGGAQQLETILNGVDTWTPEDAHW